LGVKKYRSIEEAKADRRWLRTGDPSITDSMRYLWKFASAFGPLCMPRGVRKYRSAEEADQDRQRWEQERFRTWREMRRT
jgi:hypothetical protein